MIRKVEELKVGPIMVGGCRPLILIAGLCVIESEEHTLKIAATLKDICRNLNVPLVFKSSYDKANRTSLDSYRGPGLKDGLRILEWVKRELNLPLLIDFNMASAISLLWSLRKRFKSNSTSILSTFLTIFLNVGRDILYFSHIPTVPSPRLFFSSLGKR